LPELINPYNILEPVHQKDMLFGREGFFEWLKLQLIKGEQILGLTGKKRIGKSSAVNFIDDYVPLRIKTLHIPTSQILMEPASLDALIIEAMAAAMKELNLPDTSWFAAETAPTKLFLRFIQAAQLDYLLLVLDDADQLVSSPDFGAIMQKLSTLVDDCQGTAVLLVSQKILPFPALSAKPAYKLQKLNNEAAGMLISKPVSGILRFDAGVVKFIQEICSNHPYYLTLFSQYLYEAKQKQGWINRSDAEDVLDRILLSRIEPFSEFWAECGVGERLTLALMASLRGTHGLINRQEIHSQRQKYNLKLTDKELDTSLEKLVKKQIIETMGAQSFRFDIDLLRIWIARHQPPEAIQIQVAKPMIIPEEKKAEEEEEQKPQEKKKVRLPVIILGIIIAVVLLQAALFGGQQLLGPDAEKQGENSLEVTPVVYNAQDTATPLPPPPTPTATPTPLVILSRHLPSIGFIARPVQSTTPWRLFVMDSAGANVQELPSSEGNALSPAWSPDGKKIAYVSDRDGNREIYIYDTESGKDVNLTQHNGDDWTPAWFPDGSRLAFSSNRAGNWEIFIINSDGSGLKQITTDGNGNMSPAWSPDGKQFAFCSKRDGYWQIYAMPDPSQNADFSRLIKLTDSKANNLAPAWSPDSKQIAFETNRDGNMEIYVMNANGGNVRNITKMSGANDHGPIWSPDGGRLLFYSNRKGDWDIFIQSIDGGAAVDLTNTTDKDEQTPTWRP
jgi:TolB protein